MNIDQNLLETVEAEDAERLAAAGALDIFPLPVFSAPVSGLYSWQQTLTPVPVTPLPFELNPVYLDCRLNRIISRF